MMLYSSKARTYPLLLILFAAQFSFSQASKDARPSSHLSVNKIVERLQRSDRQRAAALLEFHGIRFYHVEYDGFPSHRAADMVVKVTYHAPDRKQFDIVSESGSPFITHHVFRKLLKDEQNGARESTQQQIAFTAKNYDFLLQGVESLPCGPQYVLQVSPKKNREFLLRGRIWVDAKDFAVTRIEGETVKSPSFWIKKNRIDHRYEKVDEFWLPAEDHSESQLRLGGHAVLSIQYRDYQVVAPNLKAAIAPIQ